MNDKDEDGQFSFEFEYAIGGLTVNGMRYQMDLIVDDPTADHIIVWVGSNNVEWVAESRGDRTHLFHRITGMLQRLIDFGKSVTILGLPLRFWWQMFTPEWDKIKKYKRNAWNISNRIRHWCQNKEGVTYVDLPSDLYRINFDVATNKKHSPSRFYQLDGVHLTREGYDLVADTVIQHLRGTLLQLE